jgi:hypothetical protein
MEKAKALVHRPADLIRLRGLVQEHLGMIGVVVERFEHHDQPGLFADFGASPQQFDTVGRLITKRQFVVERAWRHGGPFGVYPLGHFQGILYVVEHAIDMFLASRREDRFLEIDGGDKNTHLHAQAFHLLGNFLLGSHVAAGHAVVFQSGEALVGHEFELVDKIFAGRVTEHAEMGRVIELEPAFTFVC